MQDEILYDEHKQSKPKIVNRWEYKYTEDKVVNYLKIRNYTKINKLVSMFSSSLLYEPRRQSQDSHQVPRVYRPTLQSY